MNGERMGGVPMKTEEQRPFAAAGGLCGAAYLAANRLLPGLPELLLGLLLGLGLAFLTLGLLPEGLWRRIRRWKRRGE